jgi:hypothetical protein
VEGTGNQDNRFKLHSNSSFIRKEFFHMEYIHTHTLIRKRRRRTTTTLSLSQTC